MRLNIVFFCLSIMVLISSIPDSFAQTNNPSEKSVIISEEISVQAKDYFEALKLITTSLNGSDCEQINSSIKSNNTPENQTKLHFQIAVIRGDISQEIAKQYWDDIVAFNAANTNYLEVCKNNPLADETNAILHDLFKYSVARANIVYKAKKAEADRIAAEKAAAERRAKEEKERREREYKEEKRKEILKPVKSECETWVGIYCDDMNRPLRYLLNHPDQEDALNACSNNPELLCQFRCGYGTYCGSRRLFEPCYNFCKEWLDRDIYPKLNNLYK